MSRTRLPSSLAMTMLLEFALLAGGIFLGLWLVDLGHWMAGAIWGLAWGVTLIIAGPVLGRMPLLFTGVMALVMAPLSVWGLHQALRIGQGPVAWEATVNQADQHREAVVHHFRQARVLIQYQAQAMLTSTWRGLDTHHHYYVAPVVGPGWKKDQEVLVWAACGDAHCRSQWPQDHRIGITQPDLAGGYAQAIQEACARHGLVSRERPLLVLWVQDPRRQARIYGVMTWSLLVFFGLVWLVGRIIWGRAQARRRAQE